MIGYGDTFMLDDDEDATGHLHIIITKPNARNEVVTVSVTTQRKYSETLVTLNAGDHPRITHPSVIAFAYSKVRTITQLETLMKSYDCKKKPPMSEEILDKCRKAALESDNTPNEVRDFLESSEPSTQL
jgi:hypothetical protein